MKRWTISRIRRAATGFTLLELIITVTIIGILISVALPSYVGQLARGKRAEAKGALQENAQFLETYYTTRGFYSNSKGGSSVPTLPVTQVPSSGTANYTITAAVTNSGAGYMLTATAVNAMEDDACGNLTLTHTGVQGASGTLSVADCWNR